MKKSVTIELDKVRNLRYGINAIIIIEEMLGTSITKLDLNSLSFKSIRDIIYAGLVAEDSSLTSTKVGDLIDEYSDIETITKKMGEAMELAFGKNS